MSSPLKAFTDEDAKEWMTGGLITLTASSGGGKSILLQHILSLPSMRGRFSCAICVSPTSCLSCRTKDDPPNQFACIPRAYHYDLSTYTLADILGKIKTTQTKLRGEGRCGEVLLVLDDIFCSVRGAGQNCTELLNWISIKRHFSCFCCCINQTAKALAPSIRTQITGAFFSRPLTLADRQRVAEWYLCRKSQGSRKATMEHAYQLMDEAFDQNPYVFLYVNAGSHEIDPRAMVRVALAPSGKPKKFKLKFKNPGKARAVKTKKKSGKSNITTGVGLEKGHMNGLATPQADEVNLRETEEVPEDDSLPEPTYLFVE